MCILGHESHADHVRSLHVFIRWSIPVSPRKRGTCASTESGGGRPQTPRHHERQRRPNQTPVTDDDEDLIHVAADPAGTRACSVKHLLSPHRGTRARSLRRPGTREAGRAAALAGICFVASTARKAAAFARLARLVLLVRSGHVSSCKPGAQAAETGQTQPRDRVSRPACSPRGRREVVPSVVEFRGDSGPGFMVTQWEWW